MNTNPTGLYHQTLNPSNRLPGAIFVHGYADRSDRYRGLADVFIGAGFTVTLFDLHGFGKSPGIPAFTADFDDYIDDLVSVISGTRQNYDTPLVIFGHSMGGLIALKATLDDRIRPDALVLSSPALGFFEPRILQKAGTIISLFFPRLPTVKLDRPAISRDETVVQTALDDQLLYHGRIKARTGSEMVRAARYVSDRFSKIRTPFLAIHGTGDRLTDHRATQKLYDSASSGDKTIKLYRGAYHETFNDLCREQVEKDIEDWLTARFNAPD